MRKNLLLQIVTMILLVSFSSCDWDIFGKKRKSKKAEKIVNQAKDKASEMKDDVMGSFDANDPKYAGLSEEEIRAKKLEVGMFDEVIGIQDEAMGKLSDLKKIRTTLANYKGSSSAGSGGGGKEVGGSYSATSTSSRGTYKCPFAEEERLAIGSSSGSGSNGEINSTIRKLKKAEDSLFNFMNDFDKPEDIPHEEAIEYFESEKAKISSIKEEVFETMEQGEALLQTLE